VLAYPCPGPARRNGRACFTVTTRFTISENRWQRAEGRPYASVVPLSVITRGSRCQKTGREAAAFCPSAFCHLNLVGLGRLERPTSRLSGVRSNQLSYRPRARGQPADGKPAAILSCLLPSAFCHLNRKGCVDGGGFGSQMADPRSPESQTATSAFCPLPAALCLRKEVIQPQVPLRLPCYDFTPVADLTVDGYLPLAWVGAPASGQTNSHGVTGGVYKARERIHRGMLIRDY
jgi:hypothetical protein